MFVINTLHLFITSVLSLKKIYAWAIIYYHYLKSMFIYEGLVTIFINDQSQYKEEFNTLKGFEICDCILLIKKQPFMLQIL